MSNAQCYVFLADSKATRQVLTIFSKADGDGKDKAKEKVQAVLKAREKDPCEVLYTGTIHFEDAEAQVIADQNEFFEKHDSVWILRCRYRDA
ncbi:hypothetical protein [Alicyclobacillus acidoterrestris]|uniref:Uncharacterized protein n=1 Tax=Alicyclobacillus acidoterrestris (strain ATCC 49025 / DSM 3922 / CIP 106132 / NCIMB 13137 / GD3B) TaxID=1356854 RepID=A0A9E7CRX7_ALIAG|nr:hypothetical protein [Alicyclobacillus acidoterrestris]UNO48685.1 hypothetical protein K1I37_18820 [Alicyclobacillus acidoterrestris]